MFDHYRLDADGLPVKVVTKERIPYKRDKEGNKDYDQKSFLQHGDTSEPTLFGMGAFKVNPNRPVIITEGELDAAAAYQMTGYPSVSIRSSSSAEADLKAMYEYLNGFKEVIICFDRDRVGKEAAEKVRNIFAGKTKIMSMKLHKDASDYLNNGDIKQFRDEQWQAKEVKISGIITGATAILDKALTKPQQGIPLIWEGLNDITRGVRLQEVWTIGGGTGLGKSETFKELGFGLLKGLHGDKQKVGMIMLEESSERTIQCMIGKVLNKRYYLEDVDFPEQDELQKAAEVLGDNMTVADKCRSEWDEVKSKIQVMVNALGIRYIFIDHLTAIAEGKDKDVNSTLHRILEDLNHLAVTMDCTFFCISHLNQAGNKNFTEGAHVSLRDFYGSGAIMQRSNFVFGFEGDLNGDKLPRNIRMLRCLKDRNAGDGGGKKVMLKYDLDTGRLNEHEPETGSTLEDIM